jgi:hypothetical protein
MRSAADSTGEAVRWWGVYVTDPGEGDRGDVFYARFSDGSEAEVSLQPRNERCGRFVVTSPLGDSTTRPRPDIR